MQIPGFGRESGTLGTLLTFENSMFTNFRDNARGTKRPAANESAPSRHAPVTSTARLLRPERQKNNTLLLFWISRGLISSVFVPKNHLPTKISTAMNDSAELMLDSPVDGSIKAILEDAILPVGEFLCNPMLCAFCPLRLYNTRNLPSLLSIPRYQHLPLLHFAYWS